MENLHIDEPEIDETKYHIWKQDLEAKREARKTNRQTTTDTPRTPRSPQYFLDDATKRRLEARNAVHVEAQTTDDIFQRIDKMLEAS